MTFKIFHILNYTTFRCFGSSSVRVRFAPSPTGLLHLGGLRTAFFNYLFARKNNGTFILRIEDTDQKRIEPGSIENLCSMLSWTGLEPDEGPLSGGPYGPYIQSQRLDKYQEKAAYLIESGAAYRCFCSETRLELLRREAERSRCSRGYDNKCRHLGAEEAEQLLRKGTPYTVRFKIPSGAVTYDDMVFGSQTYDVSENEGDFVLLKSDGFPTYHLACCVDDSAMRVTHVLRGSEWLPSTPKHIWLHRALRTRPPNFAHLPLLTNSDRTKLSKRQEAIGVENFKDKGYTPQAVLSFLAASGGGFGKQEGCHAHDLETLISKFRLDGVNMGSCIVDLKRLDLFSRSHLAQRMAGEDLVPELRAILKKKYGARYENEETNLPDTYIKKILLCYKDRMNTLHDLVGPEMEYLWTALDWEDISQKLSSLKIQDSAIASLEAVGRMLEGIPESQFTERELGPRLRECGKGLKVKYSALMRVLRVTLTAQKDGPGVAEVLELLGRTRTLEKINFIIEKISDKRTIDLCNK